MSMKRESQCFSFGSVKDDIIKQVIISLRGEWSRSFMILTSLLYKESEEVPTAGISPQEGYSTIVYNKEFMQSLNNKEIAFILLHEVGHLVSGRSYKGLIHKIANISEDIIINESLLRQFSNSDIPEIVKTCWSNSGVINLIKKGIEEGDLDQSFLDEYNEIQNSLVFPDVYSFMLKLFKEMPDAGDYYKVIDGILTGEYESIEDIPEELRKGLKDIVIRSQSHAPGTKEKRFFSDIKHKPQLDIRKALTFCKGLTGRIAKTSTWKRANRRVDYMYWKGKKRVGGDVVVGIDTSGSMTEDIFGIIKKELENILKFSNVRVIQWGTSVVDDFVLTKGGKYTFSDGGGTDPYCFFEYVKKNNLLGADLYVMFSDMFFNETLRDVDYINHSKVIWGNIGNSNPPSVIGRVKNIFS